MKVPQFKSFVDKSDYAAIEPVFENNYIAEGPFAKQFHDELLQIIDSKYGVFASNGTVALYLAMRALGIGPGDKVIVQNITFIASANAVEMTGATPVFADVKSYSDLTVDLDNVSVDDDVKAMVVAPLFGTANSNIEEIRRFCDDHKLLLIEDAAQALAVKNNQRHCGAYGKVGTFSFYADKTITTAEGGFVVTDDEEVYNRMRYLRNQGRLQSGTFVHPEIGYNFRITDMQAALGLAQLKKLDFIKERKTQIWDRYRELLEGRVGFLKCRDDFNYIPFRVIAFVDDAEKTIIEMEKDGVEGRSIFYPLHRQPCYKYLSYGENEFPNSNECFQKGVCLPTWIGMTDEQITYVSESLLKHL